MSMTSFPEIKIAWNGVEYRVPPHQQMMLIAEVEDAIRGNRKEQAAEILLEPGGPGLARLSMAYGLALRYAGAHVSNDEVYLALQNDIVSGGQGVVAAKLQSWAVTLVAIISPPIGAILAENASTEKKSQVAGS